MVTAKLVSEASLAAAAAAPPSETNVKGCHGCVLAVQINAEKVIL